MEAQKEFFSEYTQRTGDNLVRLYADEGISSMKIKNCKEFLRKMADAEHGLFDRVVVKDISRFARNTVDLLQKVRKLKALGIETQFLTANNTQYNLSASTYGIGDELRDSYDPEQEGIELLFR